MKQSVPRSLFDLGARLGSLEGYLYGATEADQKYLSGWLRNIDCEFKELPTDIRSAIAVDYLVVLEKVLKLVQRHFGESDEDTLQLKSMVTDLKGNNR